MENFYESSLKVKDMYDSLTDKKSKEIFFARLKLDMCKSYDNFMEMTEAADYCIDDASVSARDTWDYIDEINSKGGKLFLYGAAAVGISVMNCLKEYGKEFSGFVDKKKHGQMLGGYSVISPEELLEYKDNSYVIITAVLGFEQILRYLTDNGFKKQQILYPFRRLPHAGEKVGQYFEFMEYYKGGAFIDAGCFDGGTSLEFYSAVKDKYKDVSVVAFEPDRDNYLHCGKVFEKYDDMDVTLHNCAISDKECELEFMSGIGSDSFVLDDTSNLSVEHSNGGMIQKVKAVRLDDIVDKKVGMIKMDIEGAELSALKGAGNIIRRDKPLLSICVYHLIGDVLAIMDLIRSLVPEYKFKLRHYGLMDLETVLYAYTE